MRHGHAHLVDGEVALGTDEHGHLAAGLELLQVAEEVGAGNLVIAVGDELRTLTGCGDKCLEGCHVVNDGHPRLPALLDSSHDDALHTLGLHHPAL